MFYAASNQGDMRYPFVAFEKNHTVQKVSHIAGRVIVLIPLECVNRSKLKWKMTLIGIQRYEISYY